MFSVSCTLTKGLTRLDIVEHQRSSSAFKLSPLTNIGGMSPLYSSAKLLRSEQEDTWFDKNTEGTSDRLADV